MKDREYNYWLSNINNIGPKKIDYLLDYYGSSEEVYKASDDSINEAIKLAMKEGIVRFSKKDADNIRDYKNPERIHMEYNVLLEKGIKFITKLDEEYPKKLRPLYNGPFSLYIKGKLPHIERKILAIVGTRNASAYGMELTKYFSQSLAASGVGIISGLARGIDTCAHKGALEVSGLTYGVLGCGIDICYPRENIDIYMEMQNHGAVISEYPPGEKPYASNFPMRNRIISGLSDGILVIEAKEKSGSLITVDMGLEQGKDIYAIPGRITDALSIGCNNLIKMGAKLVGSPDDILVELLTNYDNNHKSNDNSQLTKNMTEEEILVYESIALEPTNIEEIVRNTSIPISDLMEHLLKLELRDMIKQPYKNFYMKSNL
ncbi:MAG TPA: DNA-protecting protein DprA [Clostridiales bacterium]|nr:DNA-protecting protein DprA [Clostridiales bacterium]